MPPRDPKLRPALERALPANDVPGSTRKLAWPQLVLVLFSDGDGHPVRIRTRSLDTSGREVIGIEWSIAGETWQESYVADSGKIRETKGRPAVPDDRPNC